MQCCFQKRKKTVCKRANKQQTRQNKLCRFSIFPLNNSFYPSNGQSGQVGQCGWGAYDGQGGQGLVVIK